MNTSRTNLKSRQLRKPAEADLGFNWGLANTLLLIAALVVLAGGYMALARGSVTLAPLLLVLGYCGLIPAALLVRGRAQGSGE